MLRVELELELWRRGGRFYGFVCADKGGKSVRYQVLGYPAKVSVQEYAFRPPWPTASYSRRRPVLVASLGGPRGLLWTGQDLGRKTA